MIQLASRGEGAVRIADLNSDGIPDLVITGVISTPPPTLTPAGLGAAWQRGRNFRSLPDFQPPSALFDLVVGDFNRDGVPDIAI